MNQIDIQSHDWCYQDANLSRKIFCLRSSYYSAHDFCKKRRFSKKDPKFYRYYPPLATKFEVKNIFDCSSIYL